MAIEVLQRSILAKNDRAADESRSIFDRYGVTVVNLLGGAGCGKTRLLEDVIPRLRPRFNVAVLEGDLATTRDAERIEVLGVPVVQLLTEGGCHLTAELVREGVRRLRLDGLDLLIIENVGNPICPANFDLGEHVRIAVLSVPEGDDKPAKYPLLFKRADLVVVSKADLLDACPFRLDRATGDIRALNVAAPIRVVSAKVGGAAAVADWLANEITRRGTIALVETLVSSAAAV
jgi:hydrogenase nickel incorporation protein HypB